MVLTVALAPERAYDDIANASQRRRWLHCDTSRLQAMPLASVSIDIAGARKSPSNSA